MAAANKLVGVAQYPAAKLQLDPVHQLGKHLHSCPRNSDRTTVKNAKMRAIGEGFAYGVKKEEVKVAVRRQKHISNIPLRSAILSNQCLMRGNRIYLAADFPEKGSFYLDIQKSTSGSLLFPSMFIGGSRPTMTAPVVRWVENAQAQFQNRVLIIKLPDLKLKTCFCYLLLRSFKAQFRIKYQNP